MLKRKPRTEFTAEQYLGLEEHSKTKHEFYDGKWTIEVFDGLEAVAALNSIQCKIPLEQLSAKVSWLD